jgi:GT2 family glycosyltransferase
VGLLDEGFFLYEEDVDLCLRLRRAGWRVLFEPSATVVHRLGRSMEQSPDRASLSYHRSHLRFYRKHNGRLATAALRSWLLGRAAAAWLLSLGPGPTLHAARRSACDLFHVALRPSNSL